MAASPTTSSRTRRRRRTVSLWCRRWWNKPLAAYSTILGERSETRGSREAERPLDAPTKPGHDRIIRTTMCLACEQQEYFFRLWCAEFLARGEIPPGLTA